MAKNVYIGPELFGDDVSVIFSAERSHQGLVGQLTVAMVTPGKYRIRHVKLHSPGWTPKASVFDFIQQDRNFDMPLPPEAEYEIVKQAVGTTQPWRYPNHFSVRVFKDGVDLGTKEFHIE